MSLHPTCQTDGGLDMGGAGMDPASYFLLLTTKFMLASSGMDVTISINSVALKYATHNKTMHSTQEETTAD